VEIPRELSELGLRLEQWRSQQGRGRARRLPEEFWKEAAKLGERHGFARVASVLRVNAAVLRGKSGESRPGFVELALLVTMGECMLEMETRHGKMRLEMRAMPVAAMAQLVRAVAE